MTVSTPSLVRPFLEAAPLAVRPALEAVPDLDRRLWTIVGEGRTAWPDFAIDAKDVVEFIARQVTEEQAADALDGLRPADLYLACACAKGVTAAINAFDRDYMKEVDIALARMRIGPPRLSDVKQLVRQRLFVVRRNCSDPSLQPRICGAAFAHVCAARRHARLSPSQYVGLFSVLKYIIRCAQAHSSCRQR